MQYHKISVITPSYNQGKFIEQTILSVIGQQYPNLEYIVIDGGSDDETVSILKKYDQHIRHWVSEKDLGQSHAINKGFHQATGDILCWLNSDDYYLPGALLAVNSALDINHAELHYGNCLHLDETTNFAHGSYFDPLKEWDIHQGDYILQPGSFWTRKAWTQTGRLREDLHFGFDWEWYARAHDKGVKFIPSGRYYAVYRLHEDQKSNSENDSRFHELLQIEQQLNPGKFNYIDSYITRHRRGIRLLNHIRTGSFSTAVKNFLLRLLYPGLLKRMDPRTLTKYLKNNGPA